MPITAVPLFRLLGCMANRVSLWQLPSLLTWIRGMGGVMHNEIFLVCALQNVCQDIPASSLIAVVSLLKLHQF